MVDLSDDSVVADEGCVTDTPYPEQTETVLRVDLASRGLRRRTSDGGCSY